MKFNIDAGELKEALKLITPFAVKGKTRVDLQDVLIEFVTPTVCTLTVSCIEFFASTNVTVSALDPEGRIMVNVHSLTKIVAAANEMIVFDFVGTELKIAYPGSSFKLVTADADIDFPAWPVESSVEELLTIKADDFLEIAERVSWSPADEPTRYAINGVLFMAHDKLITMVATNGKTLSLSRNSKKKLPKDLALNAIMPASLIKQLSRICTETTQLSFTLNEGQSYMQVTLIDSAGEVTGEIAVNLIAGRFPSYAPIIKEQLANTPHKLGIDKVKLLQAIKQAATMTTDETRAVAFTLSKDTLVLSAHLAEVGTAEITLDCDYAGEDLTINLDPVFIIPAIQAVSTDDIEIQLGTEHAAVINTDDYQAIIMPIGMV